MSKKKESMAYYTFVLIDGREIEVDVPVSAADMFMEDVEAGMRRGGLFYIGSYIHDARFLDYGSIQWLNASLIVGMR